MSSFAVFNNQIFLKVWQIFACLRFMKSYVEFYLDPRTFIKTSVINFTGNDVKNPRKYPLCNVTAVQQPAFA